MREIKFRAWDKELKELIEVDRMSFVGNCDELGAGILDGHNDFHKMCDVEVIQFTGLKDKNGKGIFEGDILFNKGILVGVVKFGEYKCKNQSNHDRQLSHLGWFVESNDGMCFSLEYLFWNLQDNCSVRKREDQNWVEVIGNIFKNPELIGVEE